MKWFKTFRVELSLVFMLVVLMFPIFFYNQTLEPNYAASFTPYGARWIDLGTESYIPSPRFIEADPGGAIGGDAAFGRFVRESISRWEYPWWNPYNFLGVPFSEAATAVLHPPNWLRLILPYKWYDMVYLVNWALAAIFTSMFARAIGVGRTASFFAGVIVLSLHHFSIYLSANSITATLCWFPLVLYGIEKSFDPLSRRWAWLGIALGIYGVTNGFHPGPWMFSLIFAGLYFLARIFKESKDFEKQIAYVGASGLLGLSLSAFQIIPFIDLMLTANPSARGFNPNFFEPAGFVGLFFNNFFGPLGANYAFGLTRYAMDYRSSFLFLPTTVVLCAIASILVSRKRREKKWQKYWLALAFISFVPLMWVFQIPPFWFLSSLPTFNRLNLCYLPGIFNFGFAIVAAVALDDLISRRLDFVKVFQRVALFASGISALLLLCCLAFLYVYRMEPATFEILRYETLPGIISFSIISLVLHLTVRKYPSVFPPVVLATLAFPAIAFLNVITIEAQRSRKIDALVAFLFVTAALWMFSHFWRRRLNLAFGLVVVGCIFVHVSNRTGTVFSKREDAFVEPPVVSYLMSNNDNNLWRTWGVSGYFWPNSSMAIRLSTLNVLVNTLSFWDEAVSHLFLSWKEKVWVLEGIVRGDGFPPDLFRDKRKLFDFLGTRFLVSGYSNWDREILFPRHLKVLSELRHPSSGDFAPSSLAEPLKFDLNCEPQDTFSAVVVFMSTYALKLEGDIKLELYDANSGKSHFVNRRASEIADNANFRFSLDKELACHDKSWAKVSFSGTSRPPAVWKSKKGDLFFQVDRSNGMEGLQEVFFDQKTNARVWENKSAQARVFFSNQVATLPTWREAFDAFLKQENLRSIIYISNGKGPTCEASTGLGPNKMSLESFQITSNTTSTRVKTESKGVLAFVDSYNEGWTATVNGSPTEVLQVDGAFRGVCLPSAGTFDVKMSYRPRLWLQTMVVFALGLISLFGITSYLMFFRPPRRKLVRTGR